MKILFLNKILGVKQYHLASALTDKYNIECHFAHTFPFGYNWKISLSKFPSFRNMLSYFRRARDFTTKDISENDPTLPFKSISFFSDLFLKQNDFDWIYFSSAIPHFPKELKGKNLWVDIEDLTLLNDKPTFDQIIYERSLIEKATFLSFGSYEENNFANSRYSIYKPCVNLYPRVAKRTIPNNFQQKTSDFSIVVIGSVWTGAYFRDYYPLIRDIVKETGLSLTLYLSNFWSKPVWHKFSQLQLEFDNFNLKKASPFGTIKKEISKYHVGVVNLPEELKKVKATFGMKPFEYAYANVQPASIGGKLIDLSSKKEFGYKCSPTTIQSNFKNNLVNFNKKDNLMDNNITELFLELDNPN